MAVAFKPHALVHWRLEPQVTAGVVERSVWVQGSTIRGMLVSKSPREMKEYLDAECRRPAVALVDVADGRLIDVGDRLKLGAVAYRVIADPQIFEMGLGTDHARVLLEQIG